MIPEEFHLRGRWRVERLDESCEKGPEDEWDLDAVRMASRIFTSSLRATISAAFPFGQRMYGTCPVLKDEFCNDIIEKEPSKPIVVTALNSPLAIRSISSSIICSDDEGVLRM